MRKTKIICTIGPASQDENTLERLMKSGMDLARINTSHSDREEVATLVKRIRKSSKKCGRDIAIILDLQGPKIRVSEVENGAVELEQGKKVKIYGNQQISTADELFIGYNNLVNDVKPEERILIDDGKIILKAVKVTKSKSYVEALVEFGGVLKPNKGVNFPDTDLSLPSLTEKDLGCTISTGSRDMLSERPTNWLWLTCILGASTPMLNLTKGRTALPVT